MSFFNKFPQIKYSFNDNDLLIMNITKKTIILDEVFNTPNALSNYVIKSNDTPHTIAYELYDDEKLYWVVLMVNNIFDLYLQWPKSEEAFEEFLTIKYDVNIEAPHHYEDFNGRIITNTSLPVEETITITNRKYEERLNNKKSIIKLLEPAFINDFVDNFYSEISE